MPPFLLEIQNLSVSVKESDSSILSGIDFSVPRGRVCGIVGESGSGKSMTALSIMGLLPPGLNSTGGKILFHEGEKTVDLLSLNKKEMNNYRGKRIAMIFQEPMSSLNPSMKCGEQIDELLKRHKDTHRDNRKTHILELFTRVKMPDPLRIYNSYPHQLSGGQRQRVMIAMALSTGPELLIADEPTTALDVTVQKRIIKLLKDLQSEYNISVLFISHDLRLIGEIADEVVVMRNGRVVEHNPVQQIFTHPQTEYTRGLLACQPPLNEKPPRLPTIEDFEQGTPPPGTIKETKTAGKAERAKAEEKNPGVLLEIKHLSVSYLRSVSLFNLKKETTRAVNNVSLILHRGETLGLVGESGCGKTTLGKTILKLLKNHSGDILFKGENIAKLKGRALKNFRKNVQVVFQDPYSSLNPSISIGNMMKEVIHTHFPGLSKREIEDRAVELIQKVELNRKDLEKYPHQFSGGQRQRIGIARALCPEPEFLILDESVSALDVSVQAQILNLLNDLKRDFGLSYIFISHDLAVVKYMSDRMIIMKDGKIEEEGIPETIYSHPGSPYTRELISALPGRLA